MPKLLGRFPMSDMFTFSYNGKVRFGHVAEDQTGKNISKENVRFWIHTTDGVVVDGFRSMDPSKIEVISYSLDKM